ncbi:hypothetical protein D3C81_1419720 [compost metagenome]
MPTFKINRTEQRGIQPDPHPSLCITGAVVEHGGLHPGDALTGRLRHALFFNRQVRTAPGVLIGIVVARIQLQMAAIEPTRRLILGGYGIGSRTVLNDDQHHDRCSKKINVHKTVPIKR